MAENKFTSKIIKFNDLKIADLHFSQVEEPKYESNQKTSFIQLQQGNLQIPFQIQAPSIILYSGGIPKQHDKYAPTDKDRSYINFPFCHDIDYYNKTNPKYKQIVDGTNNDEIKQLYDILTEIDNYCSTIEFRKQYISNVRPELYEYQKIIKTNDKDENDEPKKNKKGEEIYIPPYVKMKLNFDFNGAEAVPKFGIYEKNFQYENDLEEYNNLSQDEKKKTTKPKKYNIIKTTTFQDVADLIKFRSKIRIVFSLSKLWVNKAIKDKEKKTRMYGISLKVNKIEVERKHQIKYTDDNDPFVDSDNDEPKLTRDFAKQQLTEKKEENVSEEIILQEDSENEINIKPKKGKGIK